MKLFDRYCELQEYIGWTDLDAERIYKARPILEPHFAGIIEDFYRQVNSHQETRILITGGREQTRTLKQTLLRWLNELFSGKFDRDYVDRRWRIGWRHVEIGLDRVYASAAFARLRSKLTMALGESWDRSPQEMAETMASMNRLLDLDLAIIELAYQTEFLRKQQVDQALLESESRLRAIINTCIDGIISIREDGAIETFNPAAEKLFGYKCEEVIGKDVSMLMPSPQREEHDGYIDRYLKTGEARIIGIGREVEAQHKDGSLFPIELAISEVDNARVFIGVIHDLSERKRNEQRMLRSERLAAIGQMIAGLAHESRNAFQRSQAALELLEMEVGNNDEASELLQKIQRALNHLHYLYEEVGDYATPIALQRCRRNLSHIWRDTWKNLKAIRTDKSIGLHEEISDADLNCSVDERAIEQMFRNVLANAIDACRTPGMIVIEGHNDASDGVDAVRISIRDDGPGIAPDARHRIFEPFFTTKAKGTGLGMAIASRIAEAHGGRIEVGDLQDSGGQILIYLPRS